LGVQNRKRLLPQNSLVNNGILVHVSQIVHLQVEELACNAYDALAHLFALVDRLDPVNNKLQSQTGTFKFGGYNFDYSVGVCNCSWFRGCNYYCLISRCNKRQYVVGNTS